MYDWLKVDEAWTRVFGLGGVLPADQDAMEKDARLILIIPGNPGVDKFYEHFSELLLENLDGAKKPASVWAVSHLNHVTVPPELFIGREIAPRVTDTVLLERQIRHKLAFLRQYVSKSWEVYLVGHSIGAYMITKILPTLLEDGFQIKKALLLFPTIERLADTPNGETVLFWRRWWIDILGVWLAFLLDWILPWWMKEALVHRHVGLETPQCVREAATNLFDSNVLNNVRTMGYNEVDTVRELETEAVRELKGLLVFYYGMDDGWCPVEFGRELLTRIPEADVHFCDSQCEHAFVLTSGEVMAKKVSKIIASST